MSAECDSELRESQLAAAGVEQADAHQAEVRAEGVHHAEVQRALHRVRLFDPVPGQGVGDAAHQLEEHEQREQVGVPEARLYGHDPEDGVGGDGAFFLLLDEPEVYGFPPDPVVTTRDLPQMWKRAATTAAGVAAALVVSFLGRRR